MPPSGSLSEVGQDGPTTRHPITLHNPGVPRPTMWWPKPRPFPLLQSRNSNSTSLVLLGSSWQEQVRSLHSSLRLRLLRVKTQEVSYPLLPPNGQARNHWSDASADRLVGGDS
jgi:hypothetical protein